MKRINLTRREQDIYNYIIKYRLDNQYSPSMRDIAIGVGLSAVSGVHRHIHSMIDKGWIEPFDGKFCAIAPIDNFEKD